MILVLEKILKQLKAIIKKGKKQENIYIYIYIYNTLKTQITTLKFFT